MFGADRVKGSGRFGAVPARKVPGRLWEMFSDVARKHDGKVQFVKVKANTNAPCSQSGMKRLMLWPKQRPKLYPPNSQSNFSLTSRVRLPSRRILLRFWSAVLMLASWHLLMKTISHQLARSKLLFVPANPDVA